MKRYASLAAVVVFSQVATAQTFQRETDTMLSEGRHLALRHMWEHAGQTHGTFAFRIRPDSPELANEWVSFTGYPCKEIVQKGPARAAMEIFSNLRRDIPAETGATWGQIRADVYSASRALHKYCQGLTS